MRTARTSPVESAVAARNARTWCAATPGRYARASAVTLVTPAAATLLSDRKSTRLNSSHLVISYAVFCLKKKQAQLHECSALFVAATWESRAQRKEWIPTCHPFPHRSHSVVHLTPKCLLHWFNDPTSARE